ncbi:MAG: prepilin-type N-terminal cleavage/methylation domain-containing protein [Verrucomicrobia bacterium]|nr:prepilin-type N-terminal cleavage/methylation domain-containing protein [Verrucomicrobiota bacterium]
MKMRKRAITLLEIMIVIVIIGIIGSVVGYSMKGSLDQGRAFKSEQGSKQVHDLLMLQVMQGTPVDEIKKDPLQVLESTGLAGNSKKLFKDGWGKDFEIKFIEGSQEEFVVTSEAWKKYLDKKNMAEERIQEEYPWAFHENLIEE